MSHSTDLRPAALVPAVSEAELEVLVLDKPEITIGRDVSCDHSLVAYGLSRKHALISFHDNAWWIQDLKSTNGSRVEEIRLIPNEKLMLEDGFSVSFGLNNNLKYTFHANYAAQRLEHSQDIAKLARPCSLKVSQMEHQQNEHQLDLDVMSTPELSNSRPASPVESANQQESSKPFQIEIDRLKEVNFKLVNKLKQQISQSQTQTLSRNMEKRQLTMKLKEYKKQIDSQKMTIAQFRTLLNQLQSSRCPSSGDEHVCNGSLFDHATVSSLLRDMTCPICNDYLISPTALNCSHVFCHFCINTWKHEYRAKQNHFSSNGICPVCRKEVQFQAPDLAFENVINMVLDRVLDEHQKEERREMMESRKKAFALTTNTARPAPLDPYHLDLASFISSFAGNASARNRHSSIAFSSDDSDDDDREEGGGGREGGDEASSDDDGDVLEIIDFSGDDDDIDISITLSSEADLQEVLNAHGDSDSILMFEEASDSDSNGHSDDSEEEDEDYQFAGRRKRPRMIHSDDDGEATSTSSLPSGRNSLMFQGTGASVITSK